MIKLNLGCGSDIKKEYINSDILGGDVKWDLTIFPWPWPDNYADEILMFHVLEHLPDTYKTINEIRRILKPNGKFIGQIPHCFSNLAFWNAQHCRYFHQNAFSGLANDLDMKLIFVKLGNHNQTFKLKLKSLIPFKPFLSNFILNIYDIIDFEMQKPNK